MSASQLPNAKDADLDRLVDGELPADEYRRVLKDLDAAPEGWKRLACAFLEGQAWEQDFAPPKAAPPILPVKRVEAWWMRPAPQWMALAAGVMLAFALGTQADLARDIFSGSGSPQLAINTNAAPVLPTLPPVAAPRMSPQALGNMQVVMNPASGAGSTSADVPLFDERDVDPSQLWSQSDPLSDEVLQQLEKAGLRVVRQRHLVPMHLEDGRQVVVPMERIQIVPRDRTAY